MVGCACMVYSSSRCSNSFLPRAGHCASIACLSLLPSVEPANRSSPSPNSSSCMGLAGMSTCMAAGHDHEWTQRDIGGGM